jgi:transcription termination/antitermination protein NusG
MSDQENNHAAEPVENQDVLSEQPDDAVLRPESDDAGDALAEDEAGVESLTSGADEWAEDPSSDLPEALEAEAEAVEPEPEPEPEVAPEPVAVAAAPAPELNEAEAHVEGMDWYIIHTYSGFENKVSESLRARSQAYHFEDRLGRVLIPTEEVVELRNGKKVTSKRLLYPGYVMVQIAMDDEIWHHVKNTPRVTGFVGGGNTPVPLTADEVNSILFRQATAAERPRPKLSFEKNETVRIVDGPFASFQGKVDEINPDRNTLRVLVTIFGRATPVELEFLQVEKIT